MTASVNEFSRSGFTDAARYIGTYRPGGKSKTINGYPYSASSAADMSDDEKAVRDGKLTAEMMSLRRNWDDAWMPELQADLDQIKALPIAELPESELWSAVEKMLELHTRHWFIHHRVVLPVIEQSNRLGQLCEEILGSKDESAVTILLHGAETMTVKSIKQLEQLADLARDSDDIRKTIEAEEDAEQLLNRLDASSTGRQWLEAMHRYLSEFGYRCAGFDLSFPTWIEDQTLLFQVVRSLLKNSSNGTPDPEKQDLEQTRDALLRRLRDAAKDKPELLARLEEQFALGQQIWPLKEDHSHYIDQASTALVRILLAEVGRRLQQNGAIQDADDVWYLNLEEAGQSLLSNAPAGIRQTVSDRRADRERFSKITPPKYLGTMPSDHEAAEQAADGANPAGENSGTLRGSPASGGEVSGVARVVLSPDDFHRVRDGDILVCRSTAPMWTPLFKIISALVSEAGGVLSHPAVVAREFNLPAVVGVQNATNLIKDGQLLTVSGTDGLVHITS